MDQWNEELFNNLSRLVSNGRSKSASSQNQHYDNVIPIAISYSSGMTDLITRSKAASGDRWTKKTRLRTTPTEDLRTLLFGQA